MVESLTFDLAEAGERIGEVSAKWLAKELRSGKIPGRKVGRQWRMTQSDIDASLEIFKRDTRQEPDRTTGANGAAFTGLTRTSRRLVASIGLNVTPVTRTDHCSTADLRRRRTTASAATKTSNDATTAATTTG